MQLIRLTLKVPEWETQAVYVACERHAPGTRELLEAYQQQRPDAVVEEAFTFGDCPQCALEPG